MSSVTDKRRRQSKRRESAALTKAQKPQKKSNSNTPRKRAAQHSEDNDEEDTTMFSFLEEPELFEIADAAVEQPQVFLGVQNEDLENKILLAVQTLYRAAPDGCLVSAEHTVPGKQLTKPAPMGPLPELIVDGFDQEQLWEQVQLRQRPLVRFLERQSALLLRELRTLRKQHTRGAEEDDVDQEELTRALEEGLGRIFFPLPQRRQSNKAKKAAAKKSKAAQRKAMEDTSDNDDDHSSSDEHSSSDDDNALSTLDGSKADGVVENPMDLFFNFDDMEAFVKQAEEEETRMRELERRQAKKASQHGDNLDDDDDLLMLEAATDGGFETLVDHGAAEAGDPEDSDEAEEPQYDDFFDPPAHLEDSHTANSHLEQDSSDESESESDDEDASERRGLPTGLLSDDEEEEGDVSRYLSEQTKMRQKIEQLEEENIGEKEWVMRGEIASRDRPKESLLGVDLEFDQGSKIMPEITPEVTEEIEALLKRRILEESWDDVVRIKKQDSKDYTPRVVTERIESGKGKAQHEKGLGELYEQDYLREHGLLKTDEQDKQTAELDKLIGKLFYKLDALTNFHFTPKPLPKPVEVRSNVSALNLEEATPDTVSEGQLLAPEEVYQKARKAPRADAELSKEEREARRRTKKRVKRKQEQERKAERKVVDRTAHGNKYNKERTLKELRSAKNVSFGDEKEKESSRHKVNYNKSSTVFKMLQENKDRGSNSAAASSKEEQGKRFKL